MNTFDRLALLLVVVGAVNWGLVGLFGFDLVAAMVGLRFGEVNAASAVIYVLVALAGIALLVRQLSRRSYGVTQRSAHVS